MAEHCGPFEFTNVPASALGTSDAFACAHLVGKTVTIYGSGVWSVDLEMSPDNGTTWITAYSGLTLGEMVTVEAAITHLRTNTKTWASGSPQVQLGAWLKQ